mmetsp:Transcript_27756/g.59775  ORF Transcript_27756/g.59775 Transcript_27756/m.59775 type:complete len:441 (+) Transcript_27756:75-1397(+)|eukprot:CAMPEP_0168187636 /NCGR_PEP_ID=MMETSP0139_2-20121125/15154_1 /TAXON_ID=44445 /ORGANISM="Pseudo-nitzschia australis, Strain 10249 10 AB" /LENGTH=440 /DNA_ID=CAMNT_0008109889 /DNA_START=145 /DNA_END=1467 /DNA_ORIENTATION=-
MSETIGMDDDLSAASTIPSRPGMSVNPKASKDKSAAAAPVVESEHENDSSNLETTDKLSSKNATSKICIVARSSLSSSSIMLTGTPFSILSSSKSSQNLCVLDEDDPKKKQERRKRKKKPKTNVRFSESVYFRNCMHRKEITEKEKMAAWFSESEFSKILKNNMKIISSDGKREKEIKKIVAKKRRKQQKPKSKNKNNGDNRNTIDFEYYDELSESRLEHIIRINRDEEQGYTIRGLEEETAKSKNNRDQIYLRAKYAIHTLQANLDAHMESVQAEYDERMEEITELCKKKKNNHRNNSSGFSPALREHNEIDIEEKEILKIQATTKFKFAQYAQTQYNKMVDTIAQRYGEICMQHAQDALEKGLEDERTARSIDMIEKSRHLRNQSSCSSLSYTTETEESGTVSSMMRNIDEIGIENNKDSSATRIKRASKKFLRRLSA